MQLLYLDEAGISASEPGLCAAGVLVHGDFQVLELEKKLNDLVVRHVPETDRIAFVFHATDIFHGSGYFDRERWPRDRRVQILNELAGIIDDMHLPVVVGMYFKEGFGAGVPEVHDADHNHKRVIMQAASAIDCAIWTDCWLDKYAPHENALMIAEDTDLVKQMMKKSIRLFRSPSMLKASGLDLPGLPLKRIVDTVHFAAKADCAALQLADLCAFLFNRAMKDKPVPMVAFEIIYRHVKWIQQFKPEIKLPDLSDITEVAP